MIQYLFTCYGGVDPYIRDPFIHFFSMKYTSTSKKGANKGDAQGDMIKLDSSYPFYKSCGLIEEMMPK